MLNQLIESKNHSEENARKNGFLLTTLGVLIAVLMSGWTYSLFAKNFGMGANDFELSNLVAPVAPVEDAPAPKPEIKIQKSAAPAPNKIVLKELYTDLANSDTPPKDLRGEKDVVNAQQFDLSRIVRGSQNLIPAETGGRQSDSDETGCGLCENNAGGKEDKEPEDMPKVVVKPSPKPTAEPVKITRPVSLGVINGKAAVLAKPNYPAAARAMGVTGAVNVQVLIDEKGNVVSATAASGHPLLRSVSEAAAKQSKFTPTFLSNQPVKVTGVIIYQFKP
ncbi:MAG TPA: TonB family protein [Pyrinomonadaceae bacterium]|jgi:TonB family protein